LTSPQFQVQGAIIEGNRLLDPETIYQKAGVDGQNVFYINTRQVEERLEQMALVRRARVSVQLPNRVHIRVTEREPVVTWVSGGTRLGVDEDGIALPTQAVNPEAITIEVLDGGPVQPGLPVEERVLAVVRQLHELRPDWRHFLVSGDRGVAAVTAEGWPVYFGWETTALRQQVGLLEQVTPRLVSEGVAVEFVDLRFPTRPYYRKAKP